MAERVIYEGKDLGLYFIGNFRRFMREQGAEEVRSKCSGVEQLVIFDYPRDVIIFYVLNESKPDSKRTCVSLFGPNEQKDQVEALILNGARDFYHPSSSSALSFISNN